jgi:uncharacterized protein (TIGR03437 family)
MEREITTNRAVACAWKNLRARNDAKILDALRGLPGIILTLVFVTVCSGQTYISTIAGSISTFPSSALPAVNAPLGVVTAVAVDRQGNSYTADSNNNQVFRIDSNGVLTVFAGNSVNGFSGDGGPATKAALSAPQGLAFDGNGNLYICDTGNFRIRKVIPQGVISTFAGTGAKGSSGDGGPATGATFGSSTRIAIDNSNNVYVADADNHRIRRITSDGVINTWAGTGSAGSTGDGGFAQQASLNTPQGMAFDRVGNLYIADAGAENVREVALGGTISTVAGTGFLGESGDGGLATKARLNGPWGVAVDQNSNLYIADIYSSRIRRVAITGIISTIAGNGQVGLAGDGGPSAAASLFNPLDLAVTPSGTLLVADSHNFRVRSIANGALSSVAGNGNYRYSGDGSAGTNATLPAPAGLVVDSAGNVTICDNFANRVRTLNSFGIVNLIAGSSAPGFGGDGGPATSAVFADCDGIAEDSSGNLYIADTGNQRIRKINTAGIVSTLAGNGVNSFSGDNGPAISAGLSAPQGVAVDAQGNVYIGDTGNNRIRKVTPGGIISTIAGDGAQGYFGDGGPANQTQLNNPTRLLVDASGNLYFSDSGNNVVRQISTSGSIRRVAGNANASAGFAGDGGPATAASIANPRGLAIDSTGALLIADGGNLRIRRVDSNGVISTIAGNGSTTLSGDGRPPLNTGFGFPADVAVDSAGNIYIADRSNSRVRVIQPVPASLIVSQTGLTFSAAVDAAALQTRTVRIRNGGAGTIGWSATASIVQPASGPPTPTWLTLSPIQGTATNATPGLLTVTANAAGLAAGNYYGQIQIVSPGVNNSPQFLTVVLNVLTAAQTTGPAVNPAGIVFTGTTGGANPAAQTVTVSKLHGAADAFTMSLAFDQSAQWVAANASANSVAIAKPATITLTPNLAGLAAGVYTATLNLSFADGNARNIPLALTVGPAGASGSSLRPRTAAVCTVTRLVPVVTALGASFAVPAGWPVSLEAQVVDNCGHNVSSGTVVALFSNGDPPLAMASMGSGNWAGTWEPRATAANVSITVNAQATPPSISGSAKITGLVSANTQPPPAIGAGGIVSQASYSGQNPVSPGAMVSIFGTNLATSTVLASSLPLSTSLGGAQVLIGGIPVPLLYASPLQIDAVMPFELAVGTGQVIVQSGTALSVPTPLAISAAGPGAFTLNGSGTGAATVYAVNPDGTQYLVSTASPAHPGQPIVLYCTGLGGVQISIDAGQAAPDSPLAPANETVSITLGGAPAQILYAGLTPELVGLYQVDAVVPAGVTGDNVPLVLTSSGIPGTTVSLAIH